MRQGRCELCHALADLRDSHYLPKAGYKKARTAALKNPNPVVLSNSQARQSSSQVRDYKFCNACEKRFNEGGESWVLKRVPTDYGDPFWVHALLNSRTPTVNGNNLLFPQASIPEVDMEKLVYFAVSIFWRGTRQWTPVEGGRPPRLYLGRHEKAVRAYLLGRGKLPDDVVITVAAWPYKQVYSMALAPQLAAWTRHRTYLFYFYGFIFLLTLGRNIPAQLRRTCSYHSPEKFLTLSASLGKIVKDDIAANLDQSGRSKIKGMLEEIKAIRASASDADGV
jgi:hypothetical protein